MSDGIMTEPADDAPAGTGTKARKTRRTPEAATEVRRSAVGGRPRLVAERRNRVMTRKVCEAFLAELAMTCNVAASARAAGVLPGTAFKRRLNDEVFRAAWNVALAEGYARLELALLKRAIDGTAKVVVSAGGGSRRVREYDHAMATRLLDLHHKAVAVERARTAARAPVAAGEDHVARLMERIDEVAERLRDGAA